MKDSDAEPIHHATELFGSIKPFSDISERIIFSLLHSLAPKLMMTLELLVMRASTLPELYGNTKTVFMVFYDFGVTNVLLHQLPMARVANNKLGSRQRMSSQSTSVLSIPVVFSAI
jgi:hypothetical protein